MAADLIDEGLYQAGASDAWPDDVALVVNLQAERQDVRPDARAGPALLWAPLVDGDYPDLAALGALTVAMAAYLDRGRAVLVHCGMGVSRASLVVAACLMRRHGWSCGQAVARVLERRPIARPDPAFLRALEDYGRLLAGDIERRA